MDRYYEYYLYLIEWGQDPIYNDLYRIEILVREFANRYQADILVEALYKAIIEAFELHQDSMRLTWRKLTP